mgnify:FL=1
MSENRKTNTPSHIAYQICEGNDKDSFWIRICAAWAQKDGKVFSIQLDSVPLDGRITLRAFEPK